MARLLCAATALLVFGAIALANALSVAPLYHDSLHHTSDAASHECAVTLFSTGSVNHSAAEPSAIKPLPAPPVPLSLAGSLPLVVAALDFTRLEHAPPLFS